MAIKENQPHFILLPFMAQGHMIPMVDIARLLATHGVSVTILSTPKNAERFQTVLDRAIASGLSIQVVHFNFPSAEAGLPQEFDNYDMLSTSDETIRFFKAAFMLEDRVRNLLRQMKPYPACIISDMCFPWATQVALDFHIPRLVFHGTSCFSLVIWHLSAAMNGFEGLSDTDYFMVPDLPHRIEITKAQMVGLSGQIPQDWLQMLIQILESDREAFGAVANTFEELESYYVKEYTKRKGKPVWCIGPVSLCNENELDQAERGNQASIDRQYCLNWLDSQETSSVIYVCMGSLSRLSTSQLIELGLGLEASYRPFIWVIRKASDELTTWLVEERFEERVKGRGILIKGWAPQVLTLSHPCVGGFLTHCGWNSMLEGIAAGVPMLTWPVFAEQFINERFVVSAIETGVKVGVELPVYFFEEEEKMRVQVRSGEIKDAIEELMSGEERRMRARKLGETARSSMDKDGSSYLNIERLIRDVMKEQPECIGQSGNNITHTRCD